MWEKMPTQEVVLLQGSSDQKPSESSQYMFYWPFKGLLHQFRNVLRDMRKMDSNETKGSFESIHRPIDIHQAKLLAKSMVTIISAEMTCLLIPVSPRDTESYTSQSAT